MFQTEILCLFCLRRVPKLLSVGLGPSDKLLLKKAM